MNDRERAEALLKLAEEATPGPWDDFQRDNETGYWVVRYCYGPGDPAFIAAARNDAPEVARQLLEALNRIEQLEAELEAQKGVSAYFADRANELEGDA